MIHIHRYKPVAARPFVFRNTWEGREVGRTDKTYVLMRCELCPKVKTKELDGNWKLDEIKR